MILFAAADGRWTAIEIVEGSEQRAHLGASKPIEDRLAAPARLHEP